MMRIRKAANTGQQNGSSRKGIRQVCKRNGAKSPAHQSTRSLSAGKCFGELELLRQRPNRLRGLSSTNPNCDQKKSRQTAGQISNLQAGRTNEIRSRMDEPLCPCIRPKVVTAGRPSNSTGNRANTEPAVRWRRR